MKKLLSVLITLSVLGTTAVYAGTKPVPIKKVEKKHKKAESSTKVADDKPTKPAAPAKKKK